MLIKDRMTADPYTIKEDAPISDVISLMHEKNIRRVPVTNARGGLAGIITDSDINKVSPTKATSLSVYEVNYLLTKTQVKDAMVKEVMTISPDAIIDEAAVVMREHRVGTLVVVDQEGLIAGIITESDIFDAFISFLGCGVKGTRISLTTKDVPGIIADISSVFAEEGVNISNIANFSSGGGMAEVIVRAKSLNTESIVNKLSEHGYLVNSVIITGD